MAVGTSKDKHQVGGPESTSPDGEQTPPDQHMTCPKALLIFITETTNFLSTTTIDWLTLPLTVFISPRKLGQTRPGRGTLLLFWPRTGHCGHHQHTAPGG